MHKHYWDFYDPPLVYEAFIGAEGLKNPGLRLSWTAPVDFLLQFNFEVFQGVFDESPTFNAVGYDLTAANGAKFSSKAPFVPALYVGSMKTSFDCGNHVFLLGASAMYGHSTQTHIENPPTDADMAFSAPGTVLYDAELTYKYLISSYRSITWQSEYLGRISSGDLALYSDGLIHHQSKRQGGLYSQLIWRFDQPGRWRVGARYDLLAQNSITINGAGQPLANMFQRYTGMLEFSPTEFSRFRLQYAYDRSRHLDGVQKPIHEVLLQVNVAVGPHGAHSF
jgi:outer membrane receptor protein involved in Fe transport